MSEQLPTQPQFDPLAEARSRADVGRQIYDQMMEENLDPSMSVQDRAQGHADMADYLEKRPTRAPKHMKDGKGFDVAHYNDTLDETSLETQSLNELVTSWAESEDANDRTKAMDVQDEIERRLLKEENMSDDLKLSLIDRLSNQKDALRKNSAEKDLRDRLDEVPDQKPGEGLPWDDKKTDGNDQEAGTPEIALPEQLQARLTATRDEYVRLSAKRSGLVFGRRNKKQLAAAQLAYNEARDAAGAFVAEQMQTAGQGEQEIGLAAIQGKVLEGHELARSIYDARVAGADGKKLRRFYEFWARQGTGGKFFSRGNAVKAVTMAGIGIVPGMVAGVAGAAFLGPIAGALAGGYIARSVARGLMGAKINKEADAVRVAAEQRDASIAQTDREAFENAGAADGTNTAQITESITGRTEAQRKRNRNRAVAGVMIAAAAGAAGAAIAGHIPNPFGGGPGRQPIPKGARPTPPKIPTNPLPPEAPLPPTGPKIIDISATDGRLPWTHVTERIGQNGTPKIFEAVEKGRAMGINIVGKGRGLESVTYNGVTYTDNAHINGALDYILNNSK